MITLLIVLAGSLFGFYLHVDGLEKGMKQGIRHSAEQLNKFLDNIPREDKLRIKSLMRDYNAERGVKQALKYYANDDQK